MSCAECGSIANGSPKGCKNNGSCMTGGCNRMNTYDWLSKMDIYDPDYFDVVEVSFKNGARKDFFKNPSYTGTITGDMVVVDVGNGYNVGKITLSGELVRAQMKKKRVPEDQVMQNVVRKANSRDLEKLMEARSLEKASMVRARVISRTLDLQMKVGDVEYRADCRKATFYYTAEGRVDFRELVRNYAKEFRVKIEMRQIGARQESARIGGLGSCGRELCCSTWLTDFKSVSTTAARYQNLSINQSKLSGQCGRLKCCLNYELESYIDALQHFPKNADELHTEHGRAVLIKTDIFKGLMYYVINTERGRGNITPLTLERVKYILELNKKGEKAPELLPPIDESLLVEEEIDFADVTGEIELPMEKRRRRKSRRRKPQSKRGRSGSGTKPSQGGDNKSQKKQEGNKSRRSNSRRRPSNRNKKREGGPSNKSDQKKS